MLYFQKILIVNGCAFMLKRYELINILGLINNPKCSFSKVPNEYQQSYETLWETLKGLPLENYPPFLLQICPKFRYFIHEYACLLPERLAKNTYACGHTASLA